jgi:hypothetical protein
MIGSMQVTLDAFARIGCDEAERGSSEPMKRCMSSVNTYIEEEGGIGSAPNGDKTSRNELGSMKSGRVNALHCNTKPVNVPNCIGRLCCPYCESSS